MKNLATIQAILALLSGLLLIGYGGMDDSPGAQGIGLLTALCSVLLLVHYWRSSK